MFTDVRKAFVIFERRDRRLDWRGSGQALPHGSTPLLAENANGTQVEFHGWDPDRVWAACGRSIAQVAAEARAELAAFYEVGD